MKVGSFINSDKLQGAGLFFESATGSFYMENGEMRMPLTQAQVIALHQRNVIKWDNMEMARTLMASQNRVADAPFGGVEVPDANNGIKPQTMQSPKRKLFLLAILMVLVFVVGAGVLLSLKACSGPVVGNSATTSTDPTAENGILKKAFPALQKKISSKKDFALYGKSVNKQKVAATLAKTYAEAYKEAYPKTSGQVMDKTVKVYVEAYNTMVEQQIKSGTLRGTVFDGEVTDISTGVAANSFTVTLKTADGLQVILLVLKNTDGSYVVEDMNNGLEFNRTIIKKN